MGIIGSGKTFGDCDAYKNRGYTYSLRTSTSNTEVYMLNTKNFLLFIRGHGKELDFKAWARQQDTTLINKLAANLVHSFNGMNIDGARWNLHEREYRPEMNGAGPLLDPARYTAKPGAT